MKVNSQLELIHFEPILISWGCFSQKVKVLFAAAGEQQKRNWSSFRCCGAKCFPSFLVPHFPGPLTASGGPSPWGPERRAQSSEGWVVRGEGMPGATSLQDQPDSRALWRGRECILRVFAKNEKGDCLYKTERKPLEPLSYTPFKGSRVFHQVIHSA